MRIRRDDLYAQIWSEPATKLAQRFDVSSSYLARVCEGLNVPHPPRGYWARRAAGEEIPIPPLPAAGPGDPVEWIKGVAVPERLIPIEPDPAPSKGRKGAPARPTRHALVVAWKGFLDEAIVSALGYQAPRKKNVLDAYVTKAMIRAAADALNALFVELEARGHKVQLSGDAAYQRAPADVALRAISDRDQYDRGISRWQPGRSTVLYINGAVIGLMLFELTEHVRVRRTGEDRYVRIKDLAPVRRYAPQSPQEEDLMRDMPTGRLVLRAYVPVRGAQWTRDWVEAAAGGMTAQAKEIADALEGDAPAVLAQLREAERRAEENRVREERRWREYQKEERVRRRAQAREEALKELREIIGDWNKDFALQRFFEELSRHAETLGPADRDALLQRIDEARALVGNRNAIERFLNWRMPARHADTAADADD